MEQQLSPGTYLHHGKYKIVKELGHGGFGITYLAIDTENHTEIAIKEYFPKLWCHRNEGSTSISITHNENKDLFLKGKERFIREAKNLNKLSHPDIVKVYGAFEENKTAYYVMEYIKGITLAKKVENNGKMPTKDAILIMDQLCDAVTYIHSKNMTHYDLKPQNIMIRELNRLPVIIDFGLSKQFDSQGDATSTMMFAHSDGYSPIELYSSSIQDGTFSPSTDVYSLAAIMYFMLRGQRPPEAARLNGMSLPSSNIPKYVYDVISKGMSFSKNSRYQTVSRFKADLDKAEQGINPFPLDDSTTFGTTTVSTGTGGGNNNTNQGNGTKQPSGLGGSTPSESPQEESFFKKYWWLFGLATIVALAIIIGNLNGSVDSSNSDSTEIEINPSNPEPEPFTVTDPQVISTYATRSFSLSGYNYKENFNLRADNGTLYVSSVENGRPKTNQFRYNTNVDAEKILDQFEGMANFWAATYVSPYIINENGFYSDQVMESTLNFLKKAMDFMSTNKGDCPSAYSALQSWRRQFSAIHKDWYDEDSPSAQKWDQWENELDKLKYAMNDHPIKPKDIYGL